MLNLTLMGICGSTRAHSSNLQILKLLQARSADWCQFRIYQDLELIPPFNPDKEDPYAVQRFKDFIRQADALIICTPEYAMGVPGALKNAIDWTVGSADLQHKLTALITASSQGEQGHASLLQTLAVLETQTPPELQLLVPFVKAKLHPDGTIHDELLRNQLEALLFSLREAISA